MAEGTVTHFTERGNYGFIETNDLDDTDEGEVFFHMADIGGPNLSEGQNVRFEIEQSDKGPRAANLTRLNDEGEPEEGEDEQGSRRDDVIVDEDGTRWVSINDM